MLALPPASTSNAGLEDGGLNLGAREELEKSCKEKKCPAVNSSPFDIRHFFRYY